MSSVAAAVFPDIPDIPDADEIAPAFLVVQRIVVVSPGVVVEGIAAASPAAVVEAFAVDNAAGQSKASTILGSPDGQTFASGVELGVAVVVVAAAAGQGRSSLAGMDMETQSRMPWVDSPLFREWEGAQLSPQDKDFVE